MKTHRTVHLERCVLFYIYYTWILKSGKESFYGQLKAMYDLLTPLLWLLSNQLHPPLLLIFLLQTQWLSCSSSVKPDTRAWQLLWLLPVILLSLWSKCPCDALSFLGLFSLAYIFLLIEIYRVAGLILYLQCSPVFSYHLEQCLAHRRCSVRIHGINKC